MIAIDDTTRLIFLYSANARTTSNALVEAELRVINGESLTIEEIRAAIDDVILNLVMVKNNDK